MPRNRKRGGIFDSYGLPNPIIGVVPTTAKTTASTSTSTRHLIEYPTAPNRYSGQNGHMLGQSSLMPKLADGLAYNLPKRPPSLQQILALKRACKFMAKYCEENSITSFSPAGRVNSDEVYIERKGDRVVFTEPIATYRSNGTGKTFGIIRLKGGEVKFKATSGWGRRENDDSLRDNEFCSAVSFPSCVRATVCLLVVKSQTKDNALVYSIQGGANLSILQQVLQFCNYLGFKLRRNCWDKTEIGRYAACHVEKKLILMLVLDLIYDPETGDIAMHRLKELWELRPPLRAQIHIDKDPCEGCRNFATVLRDSTGIEFEIITAKTSVEAESVKVDGRKQLRGKHTAQNGQPQITKYSMPKINGSRKTVDYSIPEVSSSRRNKSGRKRKRLDDDDDDDDDDDESSIFHSNDLQPKTKKLYGHPRTVDQINKSKSNLSTIHLRKPNPAHNAEKDLASNRHLPSAKQRSRKVDMKPMKSSLPLSPTRYAKVPPPPRGTAVDHYSSSVKSGRLHGHAVPSERSRMIAELQQGKGGFLSKPVDHSLPNRRNVPSISSLARTEVCTASDDLDSVSLRSSRTASPERSADALPTPEITPLTKHARDLSSKRFKAAQPVTPSRATQSSCKQNLSKAATYSSSSKQVDSRRIDLTTPEPSPLLKISQYKYTPPSKSSKNRSEKKTAPIPFRLSHNLD
ncbi:hypothetical protein ACHAPC_008454 [Botrytis cinerea]|uniref:Single-strand DNA deaminase toxin A-like C-terminal domain-containing protein n=1 Tax=Botryotinia fuckeliana (strain BcDW1) TaxID=1290391 RepID=M7U406_BOTF1|nr:hypothetical protein BcDW1_689 [Botrytis cinerea BcDW1]